MKCTNYIVVFVLVAACPPSELPPGSLHQRIPWPAAGQALESSVEIKNAVKGHACTCALAKFFADTILVTVIKRLERI